MQFDTYSRVKNQGVIYTPQEIVDLMLDAILPSDLNKLALASVCDPACGDGAFLTEVAHRALSNLNKIDAVAALSRMYGFDIDYTALTNCRNKLDNILKSYYPDEHIDFNLIQRNAIHRELFSNLAGKFTHVIGNPPYVRIQNITQMDREIISKNYDLISGASDLYLLFFELGLELLCEGGILGYITPSSWLRSASGSKLREHLVNNHTINRILNCEHSKIFPGISTYPVITVLSKGGSTNSIIIQQYPSLDNGYIDVSNSVAPWQLIYSTADQERMIKLKANSIPLGSIADIHVGIQTLADKVFILPDSEISGFETWILKPIVKASLLKDGKDTVSRKIIYPYDAFGNLIAEKYIAKNAPMVYNYLLAYKEALLNRDKGTLDRTRWYAFGRSVSILSGFGIKILTSGLNCKPNFQLCEDPKVTFYSGYCVKPKDGIDINELLAILNSDDMDFYIKCTSRPYQNGWWSYAKSFIKDFPVSKNILSY